MATVATRFVEIEFDAGVWTAVTTDVVEISTRRGRNRESGAFEAGTMTVTLRNDTRKYDPDNAAGTYYGKLRPNRRIRFRATYSAVTYDIWLGYIDRITQDYGGPNDATATITATDFFKLLNRAELPNSAYAAEVEDTVPAHWWRLDEPAGSTTATDAVGTLNGTASGVTFGAAGLITRDPGGAAEFTAMTSTITATGMTDVVAGSADFTVEAVVKVSTLPSDDRTLFAIQAAAVDNFVIVNVYGTASGAAAGKLTWNLLAGAVNIGGDSTASINDGAPHHIAVAIDQGTVGKLYIDGVEAESSAMATATFPSPMPVYIGNQQSGNKGFPGFIDEVAIYPTYLSAGTIAAHSAARATPWNGDLPGTRLQRIFELVDVTGDYELDTGSVTLQSTDLGGTALAYAQKVEETERGRLFVLGDGTVRFLDRNTAETGTYLTSQATLVDDDSGAGTPYRNTAHDVDEATIVTRATVSREGGAAQTYVDDDAVDEFGLLDEVHDGLLHNSDTYSRVYAEFVVNTHITPATRLGAVELELSKDPAAMFPAVLALDIAERVTYKRKPQNSGSTMTLPMRVEAISHYTGPHFWRTALQLTPFNLGEGGYGVGVWDSSLWDQAIWSI